MFSSNVWDSNWFLSVKGGVSAFAGKPVGHGDIFDRTKPMLNVAVGKWFTPHVGGRIAFQGFKLVDSEMQTRSFQNVHADFLYNIASHFRKNYDVLPRWDFIPYLGCGIIRNSYTYQKPFAISYGLIGRYRLNDRLHLSGSEVRRRILNDENWQELVPNATIELLDEINGVERLKNLSQKEVSDI